MFHYLLLSSNYEFWGPYVKNHIDATFSKSRFTERVRIQCDTFLRYLYIHWYQSEDSQSCQTILSLVKTAKAEKIVNIEFCK